MDKRVVPVDHPEAVVVSHPETGEDVVLVGFSTLHLCDSCEAGQHDGHRRDLGEGIMCPCKGECDETLQWPTPGQIPR